LRDPIDLTRGLANFSVFAVCREGPVVGIKAGRAKGASCSKRTAPSRREGATSRISCISTSVALDCVWHNQTSVRVCGTLCRLKSWWWVVLKRRTECGGEGAKGWGNKTKKNWKNITIRATPTAKAHSAAYTQQCVFSSADCCYIIYMAPELVDAEFQTRQISSA
jgi:hypothetical protein